MKPKICCSECNGELSIGDKFCSVCGAKIEWEAPNFSAQGERSAQAIKSLPAATQHCPLCGFENLPESRFCENCGGGLGESRVPPSDKKDAPLDSGVEGRRLSGQEQAKRKKQKLAKRRLERHPLQPWKLFSIAVVVSLVGLAIYGVTSQKEDHTHDGLSAAGTSVLQEIEHLQTIVDANPQDSQSLLRLANRLQDARFLPRAIEYYKQYLTLVPKDANARVDLGICYFETGDARTAISQMEKALDFEPLHQLGHLNLGIVNLNSGNLQKANEWFAKCVDINPNTEAGKRAQRMLEQHASIQEPTVL